MTRRSIGIRGEEGDVPRSLGEVLDRALALGTAVAASFGAPAVELVAWLHESNLETALTPDIEVIQERHHAINWLVGYETQSWSEITTDT